MPVYQYICDNCEDEFDTLQSFHDKSLKRCKKCKKNKLRRLLTLPVVRIIGGATPNITIGTQSDVNISKLRGSKKEEYEKADTATRKKVAKNRKLAKLNQLDDKGKQRYIKEGKL